MLHRAALASVLLLVLSTAGVSAGQAPTVEMFNYGFSPTTTKFAVGDNVRWHNGSDETHTATSDLFNIFNRTVAPGGTSTYALIARAGSYAYHCEIHPEMRGRVKASMLAQPFSGSTDTTFVLRVATVPIGAGFVEDIQRRKQGSGTWRLWRTTSNQTVNWTPGKLGAWQFRARLRKTSNGQATGWSSVIAISVNVKAAR